MHGIGITPVGRAVPATGIRNMGGTASPTKQFGTPRVVLCPAKRGVTPDSDPGSSSVIPVKTGIHPARRGIILGSCFRRNDGAFAGMTTSTLN